MYRRQFVFKLFTLVSCLLSLTLFANAVKAQEVNVYSARKEALIMPLLEKFKAETGIDYNLITAKADELLKRLEAEGHSTPADVFITTDAGRLQRAREAGVLRAVSNAKLESRIPQNLRDSENYWFGMSRRARVIFYARDRVEAAELSTYEALADPRWKGRICIRSSSNIYNQSMVASMIEANGIEQTEAWARGLVANFARNPAGGDTDQLRAVAAGQCDIAIANTYYYGRLVKSDKQADREVAESLGLFWPNQDGRGAHINVSGAAITQHAKHPEAAERLLEFMTNAESQTWYGEVNLEYPVTDDAQSSELLKSFGEFKSDSLNLSRLGENNRAAVQLMDRAGWR
ncbi:MAG: Fe(3+) ABC transporter substrate-binding protein [Gammaproteobacteria bacterium]|nr:Fe(3+) ABC transporter substrate-binding protein [Gammaproteobacteria bacterium]